MTVASPSSQLTPAMIESVIMALPIQGRIMLKLILLQHFDVTEEEILYMTSDRPDPRCVAGTKPTHDIPTQEAIKAVREKRDFYLKYVRLRRERTSLQCDCLKKLLDLRVSMAQCAANLLESRFAVSSEDLAQLKSQAHAAVLKPQIRALDQRWEAGEIATEDYQRQRLGIEMQVHIRLADKYRKRLDLSERERHTANYAALQDHEIGHIWGLPTGSLQARKVKYMAQFLQSLQAAMQRENPGPSSPQAPLDLWKETFTVLATRPVERSLSTYDGLERTESALLDKLTMLSWGTLGEDIETKFWLSLVQGGSSNAMHSEITRNLFGLHRLVAILNDIDSSLEGLEEDLMRRTAPVPKAEAALEGPAAEPVSNEMREHVLRSMFGEHHPDLMGGGKW